MDSVTRNLNEKCDSICDKCLKSDVCKLYDKHYVGCISFVSKEHDPCDTCMYWDDKKTPPCRYGESIGKTTTNNDHIEYINYPIGTCDESNHDLSRDILIVQAFKQGYEHALSIKDHEKPQEPCDDEISRADAIDQMEQSYNILDATDRIKALPPVTPSRRKGHWILADEQNKEDVENDNYRFICSECQCSDIHAKDIIVPYCWKCGADMRGAE